MTKSKMMVQVDLKHYEDGAGRGDALMTTWVEKDPRVKKGVRIVLKEDSRLWEVLRVYDGIELTFHELDSNHGWDNNNYDKHKGLDI